MNALQIPGGPELIVFLFVVLFNLAILAVLVAGAVFLYRRLRGDGGADQADLDALRERVAALEARLDDDR